MLIVLQRDSTSCRNSWPSRVFISDILCVWLKPQLKMSVTVSLVFPGCQDGACWVVSTGYSNSWSAECFGANLPPHYYTSTTGISGMNLFIWSHAGHNGSVRNWLLFQLGWPIWTPLLSVSDDVVFDSRHLTDRQSGWRTDIVQRENYSSSQ